MRVEAVVWHEKGRVSVDTWELPPSPPSRWLRIEVHACGICGSDIEEYRSGPVVLPVVPHESTGRSIPLVLGHEFAGVVDSVGAEVETFAPGDRVVSDSLISCGECVYCRRGANNRCIRLASVGLQADGGLATFVDAPANSCLPVAYSVPLDIAALAEPLAAALRAVRRAEVDHQSTVAVLGSGAIGTLVCFAARLAGAQEVVAVDLDEGRLSSAIRLGAHRGVKSIEEAELSDDKDWTLFECTGSSAALSTAISRVGGTGRIILVGVHPDGVPFPLKTFLFKELTLISSLSHDRTDFERALAQIERHQETLKSLIATHVPLRDVPDALRELAEGHQGFNGKVIVCPKGDQWAL